MVCVFPARPASFCTGVAHHYTVNGNLQKRFTTVQVFTSPTEDHPRPTGRTCGTFLRTGQSVDGHHRRPKAQSSNLTMLGTAVKSEFYLHPSAIFVALTGFLLLLGTSYTAGLCFSSHDAKKIHQLRGLSFINAWTFFNRRFDFLRSNFNKTGQDLFSFQILQVSVSSD